MKVKSVALMTVGSLCLAGASQAAVTGIEFDDGTNVDIAGTSYTSYSLYAMSDDPTDVVTALSGLGTEIGVNAAYWSNDVNSELDGAGSGFYNNVLGGNLPASQELLTVDPNLEYDTFLTIGEAPGDFSQVDGPTAQFAPDTGLDMASAGPNIMSGPGVSGGQGDGLGALFITPADEAGIPDDDGRVLIGRFTVQAGEHVSAGFNVDWNDFQGVGLGDGAGSGYFTATTIPAPGALALLGVAGLAARRRRRA